VSHSMLEVIAQSEVEVISDLDHTLLASTPWEQIVHQLQNPSQWEQIKASEFTQPSPYVQLHREVQAYVQQFFPPGRPLLACITDLMSNFHRDFKYETGATTLDTPLTTFLEQRKGVCQDFVHFCISGLRSLGLACRYVSGYLETLPPPGMPKLEGADASHAWCSVFCPDYGWIDFDPTNNIFPTHQHITVAIGRDFADVSPLKGILHGGGHSVLQVAVDVNRELEVP
jgi:transglutaminase-like putative cysteine protease